ncbi:hypothetical protein B0H11DRAFT_1907404 [Mycena galericulata]|nr:hypothetical protein B0H11DRAFT_1907404 [Mycena galericulata]
MGIRGGGEGGGTEAAGEAGMRVGGAAWGGTREAAEAGGGEAAEAECVGAAGRSGAAWGGTGQRKAGRGGARGGPAVPSYITMDCTDTPRYYSITILKYLDSSQLGHLLFPVITRYHTIPANTCRAGVFTGTQPLASLYFSLVTVAVIAAGFNLAEALLPFGDMVICAGGRDRGRRRLVLGADNEDKLEKLI